ncbi:hypothetical protein DL89DRAFT_122662 [Linderina pennispora]|uniref:Zn(2)-C6 fungal-type domain-containing protein n=1 Tax=Linderina pennispora TaxID=61395 RepID=A0A1Y1WDM1_9FUNG|nr:uncharacterized protein DL89DRAFT_122662 [Linderina pennispora]ORX71264.1 hypothetical protein DL89DRAFT_122662 [Linderina pennispora]
MSLDPASVPFLHSCERCRQKKRKCSGDKPACAWCRGHGIPCRYRRSMRFKKQLEGYPLNGDAASSSGLAGTGSGVQQSESLANMYTPVPLPGPNSAQAASAPQQPRPFSQTSPATAPMSLAQTQPQGSSPGFRSRNMSLASNLSLMAGTINSPNMVSQPLVSVAGEFVGGWTSYFRLPWSALACCRQWMRCRVCCRSICRHCRSSRQKTCCSMLMLT